MGIEARRDEMFDVGVASDMSDTAGGDRKLLNRKVKSGGGKVVNHVVNSKVTMTVDVIEARRAADNAIDVSSVFPDTSCKRILLERPTSLKSSDGAERVGSNDDLTVDDVGRAKMSKDGFHSSVDAIHLRHEGGVKRTDVALTLSNDFHVIDDVVALVTVDDKTVRAVSTSADVIDRTVGEEEER